MDEVYQVVLKVLAAFFVTGILSFLLTPPVKRLAHRIGAIDVPKDARRMQKTDSASGRSGNLYQLCHCQLGARTVEYAEFYHSDRFGDYCRSGHFR